MLITTEKTTTWDGYGVNVSGSYQQDPVPDYIAKKFTQGYTVPPLTRKYSKLMSDRVWKKDAWKNCQHYTEELLDIPRTNGFPWVVRNYSDVGYYTGSTAPWELAYASSAFSQFGPLDRPVSGLPSLIQDEELGDGFVPKPDDLSTWIPLSIKAMMPRIKAELSLVNSVIELKDFRSLPHSLLKLKEFVSRLGSSILKKPKRVHGLVSSIRLTNPATLPTMSEALGVSSDAYLQTQFNILPLLTDICGIRTAIMRTRSRVNDLLVRQGKRQIKHFKLLVPSGQASVTSPTMSYVLQGGQFAGAVDTTPLTGPYKSPSVSFEVTREYIPDTHAVFHAQVEYNFWFTRFQSENARWLGLLDALGVNLNPAIIWNAIPWTFVIDWVINVSKWLDGRKIMNMEPAVNISRYMWSWRYSDLVRMRMSALPYASTSRTGDVYLPGFRRTIYRRQLDKPDQAQFLTGSGLSSRELSLGVALAIPLGKRRKTSRVSPTRI